jgi:hypothetical protein
MSSCSSCTKSCGRETLVNGLQNQILDVYNRTSYLSAPYSIGPPLASVIPSSAVTVAPVQGCGGAYGFASTAPSVTIAGPPAVGAPFGAPPLGISTSLMPSVSSGYGVVSQTPGFSSVNTNSPYQNIGVNNLNVPYGSAGPVQNVLPGTPSNGNKPIQKTPPPAADPRTIVGPPTSSSTRNLMTATGQTCNCDADDFSTPVADTMDYIPQSVNAGNPAAYGVNPAAYGSIPVTAPTPVGVAPGLALGGVGGIAVASPAFLGGTPNINVAPGVAFENLCGVNYGLNAPLAVGGPIAPPVSILGSNYLNNLGVTPYYSGLNQSEPAAVMHSMNPVHPGYMMLVRAWNGVPQVVISRPDKFGCPQFETISVETHADNCLCERCKTICITICEYNCINGFNLPNPMSTTFSIINGNIVNNQNIQSETFIFTIIAASDSTGESYPLVTPGCTAFNTSGLAIAVNGDVNRNILLYKGCSYSIEYRVDDGVKDLVQSDPQRASLIFTIDPCGQDTSCNTMGMTNCVTQSVFTFAQSTGFSPLHPCYGLLPGQNTTYSVPDSVTNKCVLATIYYQFFGYKYGGGPITIIDPTISN